MRKEDQLTRSCSSHDQTDINEHKGTRPNCSSTQFCKQQTSASGESRKESDDNDSNSNPCTSQSQSQHSMEMDAIATKHKGGEFESAKDEMAEVMEENRRLRQRLQQKIEDYEALEIKFYEISQQEYKNPNQTNIMITKRYDEGEEEEEEDLVSLSLGTRSSSLEYSKKIMNNLVISNVEETEREQISLSLALDYKYMKASPTTISLIGNQQLALIMPNSNLDHHSLADEVKKGDQSGQSAPSNCINQRISSGDAGVLQQPPLKKARVSVRVRCDTPTMNDGCQWRKYGQKIAKGNPCPRGYYRCTVAPSCPVRKQVQRCAEDMSILITTYEGSHNHPLPVSATAIASTTSAAAYMLTSGSSISNSATATTTTTHDIHGGLNFIPKPNSSSSTFAHPTITLDLTSTSTSNQFNGATYTNFTPNFGPKYSTSTNGNDLNFNYSSISSNGITNPPISWQNGLIGYATQPNNNNNDPQVSVIPTDFGSSTAQLHQENTCFNLQTLLQKGNPNHPFNPQPLPDTIAKVLTLDPTFQSVLSAALSSFITGNITASTDPIIGDHTNNNNVQ